MEEYLNKGIKEVINEFPEVGEILDEYSIGRGPCSVGTCLLKDIVEIHNLPADEEQMMMARIAKTIYPDKVIEIPSRIERKTETKPKEIKYFDENLDILKVIQEDHTQARGHVKATLEALERKDKAAITEHLTAYAELLTEHIKKEDEILYPWMDRNLSITQIVELFSKFDETDEQMGYSPTKYEAFTY
jgi:iron-sulfur cluster repair protein YtfE (RIC family)